MADFNQTREQLNRARVQKEKARLDLFRQREKLKKVNRQKEELQRIYNGDDNEQAARLRELENKENHIRGNIEENYVALNRGVEHEKGVFANFADFSDPREQVNILSDEYPFMLMPLRIETRFKKVDIDGEEVDQLWLRIFPDDFAVDNFEPFLSESEIKNARAFWAEMWQAGGIEEQERGAWKALVASHGSGRASWIIQHAEYQPLNKVQKPEKQSSDDFILVIPATELPPESEQPDILNYWKNFWLADGDKEEQQAALDELKNMIGEEKALKAVGNYVPNNIASAPKHPLTKADVALKAAFMHLPGEEELDLTRQSWTQAPRVNVMPDRFVVIGYQGGERVLEEILDPVPSPIVVGPDPSADPEEEFQQEENGDLSVNGEMKWMVDFDEAIQKGLGHKINLSGNRADTGFDRLIVLGLKLSADENKGQELLEELIEHHHYSRKGISILPQGTPTNNTEEEGSGYQFFEDSDDSYDRLKEGALFDFEDDWRFKKDGQWLAEGLGLNYELLQKIRNSGQADQCEARMMNTALWPATLGYMMESMMHPLFDEQDVEYTRTFFNRFVSGRGMIPAINVGPQPYGILPTTAFSKMEFPGFDTRRAAAVGHSNSYLQRLHNLLSEIDADWSEQYDQISHVGKSGDAHQILLDIVGLNPASVEFYQRYAESIDDLSNRLELWQATFITSIYTLTGRNLLEQLGYDGEETPDILEKLFLKGQNLLKGPLIDDQPLSEIEQIRAYTPGPESLNYIEWLIEAAGTSHDTLRLQERFIDERPPSALLYLMLHHALDLSYVEVSRLLFERAEIIDEEEARQAKQDPAFLHIKENVETTESKWRYLYQKDTRVTGDNDVTVGNYIPTLIKEDVATEYLSKQLDALEHLKDAPTARLERVFTEHIDCCTYRLDAWKSGLINYRLSKMRSLLGEEENEQGGYKQGIYLGAYGWLEDVRSKNKNLSEPELEPELDEIFNGEDEPLTLYEDDTNGGYISAPSLNHAVTAAVLRNGYLENANEENPDVLSVNLSSQRVREALSLIEGIRAGQGLAELLGYRLERALHDGHPGLELDYYIYELRRVFPLRSNKLKDTQTDEDTPIEEVEARNVVDGLALINHVKKTDHSNYPFGKELEATDNTAQSDAINEEVQHIMDLNDALSDVALSEGVFQVVQGNYDRGTATLDAFSKGNFPPVPDVVQTPRSGTNITHRIGLQLEAGIDHTVSPNGLSLTPRAQAEPALNKWLDDMLPKPQVIACKVEYFEHTADAMQEVTVTQNDLDLQPVDLLYLVDTDSDQAMTTLDNLIVEHVAGTAGPRPDAEIRILYTQRIPDKISFFELSALMKSLRALILSSKALQPNDIVRSNEAKSENDSRLFVDAQRLADVHADAETIRNSLSSYLATIEPLVNDTEANKNQILNDIDSLSDELASMLSKASLFGLPETGTGFAYARRRSIFSSLMEKIAVLIERWEDKLDQFNTAISNYNALPPGTADEDKFDRLRKAERLISTVPVSSLPGSPDAFRESLTDKRDDEYVPKLNAFKSVYSDASVSLSDLLSDINNECPVTDYDAAGLDVDEEEDQIIVLAEDLHHKAANFRTLLGDRLAKAQGHIDASSTSSKQAEKVNELLEAAKLLFGEDFKIIPEFDLTSEQADEWTKALSDQAQLLDHAKNTENIDFPVDEWMYSTARVREKIHHWENTTMLTEAFSGPELTLEPIQFPYREHDSWVALSYPEDYEIESDRLLYTAHYASGFDKSKRQCGLLIDEWTEMIPSKDETAGVTFNYDRPNTEPPQTMLLALPSNPSGEWEWNDLLDILNETLEMAKKRAVEPGQIDDTHYARFLPATVSSVTKYPITLSMNLAFNNQVYNLFTQENDE